MLDDRSKHLRRQIIRALEGGGRGHIGPSFSLVEILRVLYDDVITPADLVILSKGHGCLAQYVMLVEKGWIDAHELDRFCRADGLLGGHPDPHIPGVVCATGSLGHGLSLGVGLALGKRSRRVFVVVGDGECQEGAVWEAALAAGKHRLSNLTVIVDYNKRQSYGTLDAVQPMEPFAAKWWAFGCAVVSLDGHNVVALRDVLTSVPRVKDLPTVVLCHTVKGKGVPEIEGQPFWHHKDNFTSDDARRLEAALA